VRGLCVVKLGGRILEERDRREEALAALASRWSGGRRFVVVHGGGIQVDLWSERAGLAKRTVQGLRVTDAPTLDIVVGVLAGLVNKGLVADLGRHGVDAAGLSGADGGLLKASPHPPLDGIDLGSVGQVDSCRTTLLEAALRARMMPVVASIAMGPGGRLLNVNADAAASALASALGASRLLFLTDVPGLLDEGGRVVPRLTREEAGRLIDADVVRGGMRPKLRACLEAIAHGVREVVIAGPGGHAEALHSGKGGTHLVAA